VDKDQNVLYALDIEYKNIDKKERAYAFNGIIDDKQDNECTFRTIVQPNLDNVLTGINATFFAFGITGSGKTHTIFGSENDFGVCIRFFFYKNIKRAYDYLLQEAKR
jgi:hypothetical protein